MTEWERWEQPVGDDQMCVEYVGYHARYCGEGVNWDEMWSQGVFCQ